MGEIDRDRYIRDMGVREVSRFFTEMLMTKISYGKVPVFVEDNQRAEIYFVDANRDGTPTRHYLTIMKFKGLEKMMAMDEGCSPVGEVTAIEHTIEIERPLVAYNDMYYDFMGKATYFMWRGRTMSEKEIPKENLNVSELMKLAQNIIQSREGLILDEALKNRLIK